MLMKTVKRNIVPNIRIECICCKLINMNKGIRIEVTFNKSLI